MHEQVHVRVQVLVYVCCSTHLGVYLRLFMCAQLYFLDIGFLESYKLQVFFSFHPDLPLVGILAVVASLLLDFLVPFFGVYRVYRVSRLKGPFCSLVLPQHNWPIRT